MESFYYIVDKSCDGTYTLVLKQPHQDSVAYFNLTLNDCYAKISVSLDAVMCDHARFGGE